MYTDDIYVYNVKHIEFRKCSIKCPEKGVFDAFINDIDGDNVLTFGYINNCFKCNNFFNVRPLPYYLIKLIAKKVCIQYVHLINVKSGKHWKMDLNQIMSNID